jgi:hypothetical protein
MKSASLVVHLVIHFNQQHYLSLNLKIMKKLKLISILIILCLLGVAATAQKQCALRLGDTTPQTDQYTAYVVVYYNNSYESTSQTVNVYLGATNPIPFIILNDPTSNLYRIAVYINEPTIGWHGPYWSYTFNGDYWKNNDIEVAVNL